MAVEEQKDQQLSTVQARHAKPLMREFWSKYSSRMYALVVVGQAITIAIVFAIAWATQLILFDWLSYILGVLLCAGFISGGSILLINYQSKQFRDLVHAVVHVSGEPTEIKPPNPNDYEKDHDGFKEILQTVYELGAVEPVVIEKKDSTVDEVVVEGVKNMMSGLAIFDNEGQLIYVNPHMPVRTDPATKQRSLDLAFPVDNTFEDWVEESRKNKLSAEKIWMRVSSSSQEEGERHIYDVSASYHGDSIAEVIVTLFDRTDVYAPEEDDLDFVSFAAHELRGPITVIRGYLDVLRYELDEKLEHDQKELMGRLVVSANRLTSYINNILNASRYDRKHLKLHLSEERMNEIYNLIADDMQLRAKTQNRLLVTDIPESLPTVAADANAIGEVLSNLIDNGIKYSNEGGLVHVQAKAIPGFVEVSVTDRGIGMPDSVVRNLFHKFYRSHRSRETVSGTGIGLYICKAIVSSHGGTITARSVNNEGSTFSFTLPIYDTVAEKLKSTDNSNETLIGQGEGYIKNHSMFRG